MSVVPTDDLGRGEVAWQMLARHTQLSADGSSRGVDDRVMVREQFVESDIGTHFDVETEVQAGVRGGGLERRRDLFGVLVIGRNPGSCQTIGRGQPVDQSDGDLGARIEQFCGGVEAARTGTHHRDGKRFAGWRGCRRRRGRCGRVLGRAEVVGVDGGVGGIGGREFVVGEDRVDRAHVGARTAIDASLRIDVEHLGMPEIGVGGRGVDAVDRTDGRAQRVTAAGPGDHVGHQVTDSTAATETGMPLKKALPDGRSMWSAPLGVSRL